MAEPIELSTEPLQEPVASCDTAISCLARLSAQNGGGARIEAARRSIDLASETLTLSRLVKPGPTGEAASQLGGIVPASGHQAGEQPFLFGGP